MTSLRISLLALTALVAIIFSVACSDDDTSNDDSAVTAKTDITITATDYAIEAPDSVNAGPVSVTLRNAGHEPHHVQFARLPDGVTAEQFTDALRHGPETEALAMVELRGGPGAIDPHRSQEVVVDLEAGDYLLICFVEASDLVQHHQKGMIKPFRVTAASTSAADPPHADGEIILRDYSFTLPPVLAGDLTLKVTNAGPQPHEISLVRIAPGRTAEDVLRFFRGPSGPPPFESVGGFMMLDIGRSGWLKLNLDPGDYLAVCYVPDVANQEAHLHLGIVAPFTVPGLDSVSPSNASHTGHVSGAKSATVSAAEEASTTQSDDAADSVLSIASGDALAFDRTELIAPAGTDMTLEYTNNGTIPHNVHIYAGGDARAPSLVTTEIVRGPDARTSVQFTTPNIPGRSYFQCDLHPQMNGWLVVQ